MQLTISSTSLLRSLIDVSKVANVPDATCIVLRCGYDVTYDVEYPDESPEQFVEDNSWPEELYQVDDWPAIEEEIGGNIKALKDDEIELGRYIRGILSYYEDILTLFYDSTSGFRPSIFQRIVPYLRYRVHYDTIPQVFVDIHREAMEFEVINDPDSAPENFQDELDKRCNETLYRLNHAEDYPCFRHCRYLHLGFFKRLALIIESYLLEYGCKKDLFAYQKECGIELQTSLKVQDIAIERGLTTDYVTSNWAAGYSRLDAYTEFANYGNIQDRVAAMGVDFIGVPEVDSLLIQLEHVDNPDYPEHHFKRNLRRFAKRCKALAESNLPQEQKKEKLINLVLILSRCYKGFLDYPELNEYVTYAMRLFSVAEAAFMKTSKPICIKEICVELGCEYMLTDFFPDTEHFRQVWKKYGVEPTLPWEQYFLQMLLETTLPYHERHLCGKCNNTLCMYRKVGALSIQQKQGPQQQNKTMVAQFCSELRQVCSILANQKNAKIKKIEGDNMWELKHNGPLYAFIGVALKERLQLKQIPWKEMPYILKTECRQGYLKGEAARIKKAMQDKNLSALPNGYKDVLAALAKLPPVNKAVAA